MENSRLLWRDSLQSQGQESESVSVGHRSVEYSRSHASGYPKIAWENSSSHVDHGILLIKQWILLPSLLGACAY